MPQAGPGQVLIRNKAVAVNPVDWSIQDHGIFIKQWPNILGSDVAGEVVAAGEGVETLNIGDRVTSCVFAENCVRWSARKAADQTQQTHDQHNHL